jgi:hypothetical protein
MNNGGIMAVQVEQSPKNLSRPVLHSFDVNMLVPPAISAEQGESTKEHPDRRKTSIICHNFTQQFGHHA